MRHYPGIAWKERQQRAKLQKVNYCGWCWNKLKNGDLHPKCELQAARIFEEHVPLR